MTVMPSGMKLATSVGMPMPRLTTMPSRSSRATLRAISSRVKPSDFISLRLHYALHVDARRDDDLGVQRSCRHDLLRLGDGNLSGGSHHGVEVAGRHAVDQVAHGVGPLGADKGEVGAQGHLQDVLAAVQCPPLFALLDDGA